MRKAIALLLILAFVFTLGCGKAATEAADTSSEEDAGSTAEPATTSEAVLDVESELEGIDDLDEDFLSDDLESLDSELDFEI